MPQSADPPVTGHYAKKQLFSPSRLIAWSHGRRFQTALGMARRLCGGVVLDLGCGDGTFLAMVMDAPGTPPRAVGAEITPELVEDCRQRLGAIPNLTFVLDRELESPEHRHAYDTIFCMEVLEHVVAVDEVLDRIDRLLSSRVAS